MSKRQKGMYRRLIEPGSEWPPGLPLSGYRLDYRPGCRRQHRQQHQRLHVAQGVASQDAPEVHRRLTWTG